MACRDAIILTWCYKHTLTAVPLLVFVVACAHERSSRPVSAGPAASPPAAAASSMPQADAGATAPAPEPAQSQTNGTTGPSPIPATQPPAAQSGSAVDSKRNADSDYTATCKDGNRYHIYVDASGRVVVKKL